MLSKFKHFVNPYISVRNSKIHGTGVYARKDIKKGTVIIDYLGKKVSKEKAEEIFQKSWKSHMEDKEKNGSVYLFILDDKWDIDGDVWWNKAKYFNHSCDGNCEVEYRGDEILIIARRNIKKGEEMTYNYGYDIETWEDHPCRCGAKNCVGYIVGEDDWDKLKEAKKNKGL